MSGAAHDLYERDFYAWTRNQARMLRRLKTVPTNLDIDVDHLVEEVTDLGSEQRNAIFSHTEVLIEHLLKLNYSKLEEPRRRWLISANNARAEIERRLSATLRRKLARELPNLYVRVRRNTGLMLQDYGEPEQAAALPPICPYSLDQLLQDEWYPGAIRAAMPVGPG